MKKVSNTNIDDPIEFPNYWDINGDINIDIIIDLGETVEICSKNMEILQLLKVL